MYTIEQKNYGFKLTFAGFMSADEMQKWVAESKKALENAPNSFGVFVDMRKLKPLPGDARQIMEKGQKLYQQNGMVRSVVILDDVITKNQFKQIAQDSGIYEWERYIDASSMPNWEEAGIAWIESKVDPDK